jgi:SAM-dependent MidA family methyltransferase
MPDPLLDQIAGTIAAEGPIGFDEFMRLALYSEPHGYYRSSVPGVDSDYRTSPSLTPWFGRLVRRALEQMWIGIGSPGEFTVVEAGGGAGDLAAAALEEDGEFGKALRWCFVEPISSVARMQAVSLSQQADKVAWASGLAELEPLAGVVLANEVLDNFPVRLLEIGDSGLLEVKVGLDESGLCEVPVPAPEGWLPAMDWLEPGDRFEVICGLDDWCSRARAALRTGCLLVIDYGDVEPDIWVRRPAGSLVTYRSGQLGLDSLRQPGSRDITAHVNFSELGRAAQRAELVPCPLRTQREWLHSLGLANVIEELRNEEAIARWEGRHGDWVGLVAERSRVESLAASGGLGDYLVLIAEST